VEKLDEEQLHLSVIMEVSESVSVVVNWYDVHEPAALVLADEVD
jgi:hypothetical protein